MRRLRLAADAILDAGMAGAAGRLLDRADAVIGEHPDADELDRADPPPSAALPAPAVERGQRRAGHQPPAGRRGGRPGEPAVAVDLLFDALAAYIRAGAFADMASAIEEAVALRGRVDDERARRIDVMHGALRVARGSRAARRCSTATPR